MHATTKQRTTIGIDLGDLCSQVCVLDEHGEVLEEGRVMTKPEAFLQRFGGCPPCCIAIEAGTPSPWVAEVSEARRHDTSWMRINSPLCCGGRLVKSESESRRRVEA